MRCISQFLNEWCESHWIGWEDHKPGCQDHQISYLWFVTYGDVKSLVNETELQIVAQLTGHIFDATAQIRNDGVMLCRAAVYHFKKMRTCLRVGGGHLWQLL
jgi:hypothetical protein